MAMRDESAITSRRLTGGTAACAPLAREYLAAVLGAAVMLAPGLAPAAEAALDDAQAQEGGSSGRVAQRDEELEEVSVTAMASLLESIQDVPKSVSIVSGDELAQLDAVDLGSIFQRIGNVQWNYGNPKTGSISLRGIPTGGSETQDPSLGINFDNVALAYTPFATGLDYIDLESIDVVRGPQGFDGGRATTTGTISIRTRKPTFTREATATILLGQNDALSTQAALGGSVIDGLLAWRGTFLRNQREGAFKNNYGPLEDRFTFGDVNRTYGRVQFLLTPFEGFEALASVDFKPKGSEYVNGTTVRKPYPEIYYTNGARYDDWTKNSDRAKLNRPYFAALGYSYSDYLANPIGTDNNRGIMNGTKGASLNLTWNVADHTLTSTSGYRKNWFQAANDDNLPFNVNADGGLYVHYRQVSEELKVASNPGGALDYVVGLYFNKTKSDAASRSHYLSEAGVWQATPQQYYGFVKPAGYQFDTALTPGPSGLGSNPAGLLLLENSAKGLWKQSDTLTDNSTRAAFGKADLHLQEYFDVPLTVGVGVRISREDRRTSTDAVINDEGVGFALNPANGGGFTLNASNQLNLTTSTDAQKIVADRLAAQYFGVAIAGAPGATFNALSASQRQQVAYAKAVRQGLRGTVTPLTVQNPFQKELPTWAFSLTYEPTDNLSVYGTYQRGAKPGYAQNVTIPSLSQVAEEYTDAYEVGIRRASFNRALIVNASIFYQQLNDYQTSLYKEFNDPADCGATTPPCFVSISGNLPQVTMRGIELDASYAVGHFNFRVAAVLNDIYYSKDVLLAVNEENSYLVPAVFQARGQQVANTAKYSYNVSTDYRLPVAERYEFHVDANWNWKSKYNSDAQRSIYGVYPGNGLLDLGVGVGSASRTFDVTLLLKNVLDSKRRIATPTATSYVPATPRWFGVQFTGKL
jgi:outer membrane receptor protein involved in Fe transport